MTHPPIKTKPTPPLKSPAHPEREMDSQSSPTKSLGLGRGQTTTRTSTWIPRLGFVIFASGCVGTIDFSPHEAGNTGWPETHRTSVTSEPEVHSEFDDSLHNPADNWVPRTNRNADTELLGFPTLIPEKQPTAPPREEGAGTEDDCSATSIQDAMSFHTIPESLSYGAVSVTPTEVGGVLVGRSTNNGLVVTWLDASGSRVTPDTAIPGDVIWGIADAGNRWGVLVQIGDDVLDLVTLKAGGGALVQTRVTGGVPHDTTGNTWFGSMIQDGDLIWTGTKFAAYYTVQRLWPDGIAHYGDQLRLYDGMGSQIQELWDWGCSHSMELRLAHNGDNLGAVCASDCYPSKGIHFNHRGAKIVDDQDASNCGGRYGTSLGGVIPHNNGFWVSFTATQDRQSRDVGLRYINANGRAADEIQWVTQDDTSDYYLRSAQLGESLLIGYSTGSGKTTLVRRDIDTGGPLGAPITLAEVNSWHLSEFFTYANGDAGWLGLDQNSLKLARVRHCGLP